VVRSWFANRYGEPTDVQRDAWPRIAAAEHLLACAPTGSGKTLTAFLWSLDRLLTGAWLPGRLRVLYVSPLKALNNDVQRNLLAPLAELRTAFADAGIDAPAVRVVTRSGDTPSRERQRMLRRPPEILITTPESLNILLTSKGGRSILGDLETVILDEIHAVADGKRGVHLMTAVERLVLLSGEFQRLALSATLRPIERIAELVGGWQLHERGGSNRHQRRPVTVVQPPSHKAYDLGVCSVTDVPVTDADAGSPVWHALVDDFRQRIAANRSTLLFTNSRKLAEKITRLINDAAGESLAYAHHGSLSREIRTVVENRLKNGQLKAIVATSSLELGIDIGELDEVLLVQTPFSIASTVQRLGRAGHGVGEISRGRLYPTHGRDFLEAAVVTRCVLDGDIEEIQPIRGALDVLAQVIASMTAHQTWKIDALFDTIRCCDLYHELPRNHFDLVLDMLAGRYADTRLRTLKPRVSIDSIDSTVRARDHVPFLLYTSGGTIPDRGQFNLRISGSHAKIGELDEEFVWERTLGDSFVLGTQTWRVQEITHNDVMVAPETKPTAMAPFWRAEALDRSFHFSTKIAELLEQLNERFDRDDEDAELERDLSERHFLDRASASRLITFLRAQRAATGRALPHRHHLLIEHTADPHNADERKQVVLHTFWGGRVNRPLALALAGAIEQRFGYSIDATHEDDCIVLSLPHQFGADELFALVTPDNIEELLRSRLERSGYFGARFRENAGRALLLPRGTARKRLPLWLNRLRSKKLLAAVSSFGDFPIVLETWRSCLRDDFDLDALRALLDQLHRGEIEVSEVHTAKPSPFAAEVVWRLTNRAMYEDDTPIDAAGSRAEGGLVAELVRSSQLRPRIEPEVIAELSAKLRRTAPGYAPRNARELIDWVKERVVISTDEWHDLLAAVERDDDVSTDELLNDIASRVVWLKLPDAARVVCALESTARLAVALDARDLHIESLVPDVEPTTDEVPPEKDDDDRLVGVVGEWLQFYGPLPVDQVADAWGLSATRVRDLLDSLQAAVVIDEITAGAQGIEVCDADNLETLLRLTRARARPVFEARPLAELPLFLACHQGLVRHGRGRDDLPAVVEQLLGFPAPANAWETDLLPARLSPYRPVWLDELLQQSDLEWIGCGKEKLTFSFPTDRELLAAPGEASARADELFPSVAGRFNLLDLTQHSGSSSADVSRQLWLLAWNGQVTNDTFAAVRRGVLTGFAPTELGAEPSRSARRARGRWQATRPFVGNWYPLPATTAADDALEEEERNKERVRLLLDRYGILFRELAARELPAFQWSRLFRAVRLMELSGEVLSGYFFAGIPGPQFISHAGFRRLQAGLPEDAVYWVAATDPISPCGLGLDLSDLPRRVASNHLVYCGTELMVVSQRHARDLTIHAESADPDLARYFEFLEIMLSREHDPAKGIDIETINGSPALDSPYADSIAARFDTVRGRKGLRLQRRF